MLQHAFLGTTIADTSDTHHPQSADTWQAPQQSTFPWTASVKSFTQEEKAMALTYFLNCSLQGPSVEEKEASPRLHPKWFPSQGAHAYRNALVPGAMNYEPLKAFEYISGGPWILSNYTKLTHLDSHTHSSVERENTPKGSIPPKRFRTTFNTTRTVSWRVSQAVLFSYCSCSSPAYLIPIQDPMLPAFHSHCQLQQPWGTGAIVILPSRWNNRSTKKSSHLPKITQLFENYKTSPNEMWLFPCTHIFYLYRWHVFLFNTHLSQGEN